VAVAVVDHFQAVAVVLGDLDQVLVDHWPPEQIILLP